MANLELCGPGGKLALCAPGGKLRLCITPPVDCCLYPWPDPNGEAGGPYYPATDLLDSFNLWDAVVAETIVMTRSGYGFSGTGTWGTYSVFADSSPLTPVWVILAPPSPEDRDVQSVYCLISGDGPFEITDNFSDTIELEDPGIPATCELLRVSLCCWEGNLEYENEFGQPVSIFMRLCYYAEDPSGMVYPDGWPGKPCWLLYNSDADIYYAKDDPQNGPLGTYSGYVVS